jgi:hypothetical protein
LESPPPQRLSLSLQSHLFELQLCCEPPNEGHCVLVVQVHWPEASPLPEAATQVPEAQVTPHTPQFVGSAPRSLHAVALGAVEQHTLLAPPHCLCRQFGSAQSTSMSQSLSTPSLHEFSTPPLPPPIGQVQVPPSQTEPAPQMLTPHWQLPLLQVLACTGSHAVHTTPLSPQALTLLPLWQVLPLQQPLQLLVSHTHTPFWQRWPELQMGPVPQVHAPAAEQPSARVDEHELQLPPGGPQLERVCGL